MKKLILLSLMLLGLTASAAIIQNPFTTNQVPFLVTMTNGLGVNTNLFVSGTAVASSIITTNAGATNQLGLTQLTNVSTGVSVATLGLDANRVITTNVAAAASGGNFILYHGRLNFATLQSTPGVNSIADMQSTYAASTTQGAYHPAAATTIKSIMLNWYAPAASGTNCLLNIYTNDVFMCGATNNNLVSGSSLTNIIVPAGMVIPANVRTYIEVGANTNGVASQTIANVVVYWIVMAAQ